jgi:hypothetical protein
MVKRTVRRTPSSSHKRASMTRDCSMYEPPSSDAGVCEPSACGGRHAVPRPTTGPTPCGASRGVSASFSSPSASGTVRHRRATTPWASARPRPALRRWSPAAARPPVQARWGPWAPFARWTMAGRATSRAWATASSPQPTALVSATAHARTDQLPPASTAPREGRARAWTVWTTWRAASALGSGHL